MFVQNALSQLDAINNGHCDVRQNKIEGAIRAQSFQTGTPVLRGFHLNAIDFKQSAYRITKAWIVIDNHDTHD